MLIQESFIEGSVSGSVNSSFRAVLKFMRVLQALVSLHVPHIFMPKTKERQLLIDLLTDLLFLSISK